MCGCLPFNCLLDTCPPTFPLSLIYEFWSKDNKTYWTLSVSPSTFYPQCRKLQLCEVSYKIKALLAHIKWVKECFYSHDTASGPSSTRYTLVEPESGCASSTKLRPLTHPMHAHMKTHCCCVNGELSAPAVTQSEWLVIWIYMRAAEILRKLRLANYLNNHNLPRQPWRMWTFNFGKRKQKRWDGMREQTRRRRWDIQLQIQLLLPTTDKCA